MSPDIEQGLWEAVGVDSLAKLPDFPFTSHGAFVAAVRTGDANIGIDYAAARELAHLTRSKAGSYALHALSCIPVLFLPVSMVVAVVTASWAILAAIPIAFIAMFVASPYSPWRTFALLCALASVYYCWDSPTIFQVGAWSTFAFSASFFAVRIVNWAAWNWAYKAIIENEAFAAYFWKLSKLYIKSRDVS